MTDTPDATPAPETPTPTPPPASPKPGALLIAVMLVLLLFVNVYYDSRVGDYDGKYLTFGVIALIAGVLGVDLSRFWRGKDE